MHTKHVSKSFLSLSLSLFCELFASSLLLQQQNNINKKKSALFCWVHSLSSLPFVCCDPYMNRVGSQFRCGFLAAIVDAGIHQHFFWKFSHEQCTKAAGFHLCFDEIRFVLIWPAQSAVAGS